MKLTRHVSRREGDREYHKWTVNLSPQIVEELGWAPGTALEGLISGDQLILRPMEAAPDEAESKV